MIIRADLHVHSLASPDGVNAIDQLASAAMARGLHAIAITDHDQCTALPEIPGVLLIPAVEVSTDSGHVLGLFLSTPLDEKLLRSHPSIAGCVAEIHRCGGLAVLAHPFAPQKLDAAALRALPVDAMEAANARAALHPRANGQAAALAEAMRLSVTGGSDAHSCEELANAYTEFDAPECSIPALREALRDGHCRAVLVRPCRWRDKGRSKLQKARRSNHPIKRLHARGYQLACVLRDMFHI